MGSACVPLADRLDALLPQTQCGRCGHGGCRPYAEAMANALAPPNRCPPGGESTLAALCSELGVAPLDLDPATGAYGPPTVAMIDESVCIGCAKCLPVCPVDAIVGARRYLHTVIAAECSGCELCIPACPVDCIVLLPTRTQCLTPAELGDRAGQYRARYDAQKARRAAAQAHRARALGAAASRPESP